MIVNMLLLERIHDAMSCPVEHPVPEGVFSYFEVFNPMTMEVVSDITDYEVRMVRLMNEFGQQRMRIQEEISAAKKAKHEDVDHSIDYMVADANYRIIGQLITLSLVERLGKNMRGQYGLVSNGKVVRRQTTSRQITH